MIRVRLLAPGVEIGQPSEVEGAARPDPAFRDRFVAWLTGDGAATRSVPELLDAWCRFLDGNGFEVYRCNLATEAVHPLIANTRHVWFPQVTDPGPINPAVVIERRQFKIGGAMVDEVLFNTGSQRSPQYLASPFARVEIVGELYEPIHPVGTQQLFPLFDDLARAGCSAYYARRLTSFAGLLQKLGLSTRLPGGFDPERLGNLRWCVDLFTLHLNTLMENVAKETLARCYLGVDPGRRVCDGLITRGSIVSDAAAVWFSDLRGFTVLGEEIDQGELVAALNDYFDAVVPPIYEEGGEVLKFIGDAILAVFPYRSFDNAAAACRAALSAARVATATLETINVRRSGARQPLLRHGVGIASGAYSYGNIGAEQRLDFTAIGATVNLASRVESLTRELDRTILCTGDVAELVGENAENMGCFALKGITGPVSLFSPAC